MGVMERVKSDTVKAMKSGDKVKLNTLRAISAAVLKAETSGKVRRALSDDEIYALMNKEIKTRLETAAIYRDAGETERALQEYAEADIISDYTPALLSEEETEQVIFKVIEAYEVENETSLSAIGPRAIGIVMKELKKNSNIDFALASNLTRKILAD